jgi:hypothetical protein
MLDWLIRQPKCINIQFMETTISPLNQKSQKLFIRFAKDHNVNFQTRLFLDKFNFDNESHEEEILYTIFPLNLKNKQRSEQ